MDEGRLTDSQGKRVDFRNTLIIMTSNLGADALASLPDGAPSEQARPQVLQVGRGTAIHHRKGSPRTPGWTR